MSMATQPSAADIGWEDILPEPFVLLLLGARGEGKTALSHRLLEVFDGADRDAYIMGFPADKAHLLPDSIAVLPADTPKDAWPEDSIVLIHEAHHLLHARRSMDAENLELDELVTVSRHKNSDIIYDTQQSQRLDKNAVAAVDGIAVRWPSLMQKEFERRAIRPIIEEAQDALSEYITVHAPDSQADDIVDRFPNATIHRHDDQYTFIDRHTNDDGVELLKKHVYVYADRFRGVYPGELELADHWSEDISKAYGEPGDDDSGASDKTLDDIRADMADPEELDDMGAEKAAQIIARATPEGDTDPEASGSDDDDTPTNGDDTSDLGSPEPAGTDDSDVADGEYDGYDPETDDDYPDMDAPVEWIEDDNGVWYPVPKGGRLEDGSDPFPQQPALTFIEQMKEADNQVFGNDFDGTNVELLVPRSSVNEVRELVNSKQISPSAPTVRPGQPSIAEERPREASGLVSFQFAPDAADEVELTSSGYDIEAIVDALQASDEPLLVTVDSVLLSSYDFEGELL